MAINKENLNELTLISDILYDKNLVPEITIVNEAVEEAIESDGKLRQNISIILSRYPKLYRHLKYVVDKKYPEYNRYIEKIAVLV